MIIETKSAKETYDLGKKIGSHAKAGEVYTLVGDLGVGKTVFTQGLAKGLGIEEPISSPTFTIVQVYDDGRLPFYHFDVYRIGDIEEMDDLPMGLYRSITIVLFFVFSPVAKAVPAAAEQVTPL